MLERNESSHNYIRDRAQNKEADPVPDGIELAEPTTAPSRHRLTAELAKSRLHHIQTDLKGGPTVGTTTVTAFTSSLEGRQIICLKQAK